MSGLPPTVPILNMHQYGLTAVWSVLANFSVFFAMYKYREYGYYVHMIMGILSFCLTLGFTLAFLIPFGYNAGLGTLGLLFQVHGILGMAVIIIVGLQVITGSLSRYLQIQPQTKTNPMLKLKTVHRSFGYAILLISKIGLLLCWYGGWGFWLVLVWEIIWIVLFFLRKSLFPKLQARIANQLSRKSAVQKITDINTLKGFNYVIFADYIYNIDILKTQHPGGWAIISSVQGREIDRFIYGMYSSDLMPQVPVNSHSFKALQLLGKPIGKIDVPSPFSSWVDSEISVTISFKEIISKKGNIYSIGLSLIGKYECQFHGYSDLRQLGQYFSLTYNGTTRLYTSVYFLRHKNRKLMLQIFPNMPQIKRFYEAQNLATIKQTQLKQINDSLMSSNASSQRDEKDYIPLMMKKYTSGKLTPQILGDKWISGLKLSNPKGKGLDLMSTRPGKIIIVAGGTGLYPFSDLIDLLFKSMLMNFPQKIQANNKENVGEIIKRMIHLNPILQKDPFKDYSFELLLSVNLPQDIHPITLYQISELCEDGKKLSATIRVSKWEEQLSDKYKLIKFIKQRFQGKVKEIVIKKQFSKIWICGPPRLNTNLLKQMISLEVPQQDYLLI